MQPARNSPGGWHSHVFPDFQCQNQTSGAIVRPSVGGIGGVLTAFKRKLRWAEDDASFRRKLGDSYLFYYKSNRKEYTHQLGLADYGEEKTWVAYARDRA